MHSARRRLPPAIGSRAYETIGSTSTEALAWATLGDPGRLWVVASEQTAGHGRRGRGWQTPRGNLAASLLLVQPERGAASATLGFAAGLALESAIRAVAPSIARQDGARWRVGERRPARAQMAERRAFRRRQGRRHPARGGDAAGAGSSVVIGIGVNVRHAPKGMPYPVTSLVERGADVSAETLFTALAEAWVDQEALWNEGRGFAAIRDRWLERAAGLGAPIAVKIGEDVLRGTFETIDDEGRLIVRAGDGSSRAISAGEVHFGAAATAGH